jgi:hypothetical protein
MNRLKLLWLIPMFTFCGLSSCSKILSQRTDEQAWLEFDKDVRSSRTPASFIETKDAAILSLHETLGTIPVRSILLKCGNANNSALCFRSSLTLQFDEAFRKTQAQFANLKLTDYKREQLAFFDFRSYDSVFDEVNHFHQSILSGLDLKARTHATELFKTCAGEAKQEATIENFNVLTNLVSEVPKGTYACMSNHWLSDEKQLLDETTDRLGLTIATEEAKLWIEAQQISPIYEAEINTSVSQKAKAEHESFQHEKDEIFAGFNAKAKQDQILKEWSAKLRERYPYSPVEQWVISYAKEHD